MLFVVFRFLQSSLTIDHIAIALYSCRVWAFTFGFFASMDHGWTSGTWLSCDFMVEGVRDQIGRRLFVRVQCDTVDAYYCAHHLPQMPAHDSIRRTWRNFSIKILSTLPFFFSIHWFAIFALRKSYCDSHPRALRFFVALDDCTVPDSVYTLDFEQLYQTWSLWKPHKGTV